MRFRSTFALALQRLRRRPLRSFLLLQGTVWGVAVAILPVAVTAGTRAAARTNAQALGADRLSITADPTGAVDSALVHGDIRRVRDALRGAGHPPKALGAVRYLGGGPIGAADTPHAELLAATPGALVARGLVVAEGRDFRADDSPSACIVEAGIGALRGRPVALGDTLAVAGRSLTVVGITRARDPAVLRTNDFGFDTEHAIYKSIGAAFMAAMGAPYVRDDWKRTERCVYVPLRGTDDAPVDWIFARVSPDSLREAACAVQSMFASTDRPVVALHPTVLPIMLSRDIDRFDAVNIAMFLACLFMGAVVMANLGLLSTLSRAREIAIRRVEGATRAAIAWQFLLEGLVLAAVGSVLGCVLGMGLARLRVALSPVTGFAWTFPWAQAAIAVAIALALGLAASALPAWRAARQSPLRALADE